LLLLSESEFPEQSQANLLALPSREFSFLFQCVFDEVGLCSVLSEALEDDEFVEWRVLAS